MGLKRLCLFCAALLLATPSSYAANFSGEYLLKVCGQDEEGGELVEGGHIACQAYIAGVVDYHKIISAMGTAPSVDFCVPDDANIGALQDIVWDYISKNRFEHGKFIAAPAVALALYSQYPCK